MASVGRQDCSVENWYCLPFNCNRAFQGFEDGVSLINWGSRKFIHLLYKKDVHPEAKDRMHEKVRWTDVIKILRRS